MPANEVGSSAHAETPDDDGSIAPVVMLLTRRRLLPPPSPDAPVDDKAAQFWKQVFDEYDLRLNDSAPIEDVLKIVAERLEAMVTGLLYLREGGGPRDLAANPESGIDYTGAKEVVGLLREMAASPAAVRGVPRRR